MSDLTQAQKAEQVREMDLLRFATAGSVDDGKSTLIGRLLLDSKSIFEDQMEAVEATSLSKGYDYTDLALLTESEHNPCREGEVVEERTVRFRTVGDLTLTGCVESEADTIDKIIDEIAIARVTERGATRGDDRFSEAAMEDRKKEGYF